MNLKSIISSPGYIRKGGADELEQGKVQREGGGRKGNFIYRRPTLYPLEIAVDFLKSL
jgi:hypothetical protein